MKNIIGTQPVLLPQNCDMHRWSVVACDQFTTKMSYWEELDRLVGEHPSTLRLTFPEIFLREQDIRPRIEKIDKAMNEYLEKNLFREIDGMVLVERTYLSGEKRIGLVLSVDLDCYDYRNVRVPVRATERTILDRLPVRMKIREKAPVELPHILLLIDDRKKEIIENLYAKKDKLEKLYDFDLNMNGGHVRGYKVPFSNELTARFMHLMDKEVQEEKYGTDAGILFAVGDGNHSMATAKEHWNKIKESIPEGERENHPAKYVLTEVVNLYQKSMDFEAIHRVLLHCDPRDFIEKLGQKLSGTGKLEVVTSDGKTFLPCPAHADRTIKAVQDFLLSYASETGAKVEYEHAKEQVYSLARQENTVGIVMPVFEKEELFNYVVHNGNLPQKAFSIGTEENKKYYIEAKRIMK